MKQILIQFLKRFLRIEIENMVNRKVNNKLRDHVSNEMNFRSLLFDSLQGSGLKKIHHQLDNGLRMNVYFDSIICKQIFQKKYEKKEIHFARNLLSSGDIFIDIGAHIGIHSLYASKEVGEEGRVYSFEPTPETFGRLNENVSLNRISNIYPVNKALGDKNDNVEFFISGNGYDAWNGLTNSPGKGLNEVIRTDVITIDDFLQNENIDQKNIRLIKIDVEGFELAVLKGAEFLLRTYSPFLMIEFSDENAQNAGFTCKMVYDYMKSLDYEWYSIENNMLVPHDLQESYFYDNLIAVKGSEKAVDFNHSADKANYQNKNVGNRQKKDTLAIHSLKKKEQNKLSWLADLNIQTIIDIGANEGQFIKSMLSIAPHASIICFEPLQDCYQILVNEFESKSKFKAFNLALGERNGTDRIFKNAYTPSSSLLPMSETHTTAFTHTKDYTEETIEIRRLDDIIVEESITFPLLIKIDVQGYEDLVISGGSKTVSMADVVIIEVTYWELYEGQKLFHNIYEAMIRIGFFYAGNIDQLNHPIDSNPLQGDAIFIKPDYLSKRKP